MAADSDTADSARRSSLSAQGLQFEVRQNLDALALFDPDVATDATGSATVEFELPDNLTRYRVMAVAVDGAERFGSTESVITARLPLQVRPSAPRFLNFGDRFELPIMVQNQTDSPVGGGRGGTERQPEPGRISWAADNGAGQRPCRGSLRRLHKLCWHRPFPRRRRVE